jgi:hypothetical protein
MLINDQVTVCSKYSSATGYGLRLIFTVTQDRKRRHLQLNWRLKAVYGIIHNEYVDGSGDKSDSVMTK